LAVSLTVAMDRRLGRRFARRLCPHAVCVHSVSIFFCRRSCRIWILQGLLARTRPHPPLHPCLLPGFELPGGATDHPRSDPDRNCIPQEGQDRPSPAL